MVLGFEAGIEAGVGGVGETDINHRHQPGGIGGVGGGAGEVAEVAADVQGRRSGVEAHHFELRARAAGANGAAHRLDFVEVGGIGRAVEGRRRRAELRQAVQGERPDVDRRAQDRIDAAKRARRGARHGARDKRRQRRRAAVFWRAARPRRPPLRRRARGSGRGPRRREWFQGSARRHPGSKRDGRKTARAARRRRGRWRPPAGKRRSRGRTAGRRMAHSRH